MADAPLQTDLDPGAPGDLTTTAPAETRTDDNPVAEKRAVDRKLRHARARLFSRIDELGRRVRKAKSAMDVLQVVRDHPLAAVGIGLVAGAVVGVPRGSKQGFIGTQLTALVTGIAGHVLKPMVVSWVMGQVKGAEAGE